MLRTIACGAILLFTFSAQFPATVVAAFPAEGSTILKASVEIPFTYVDGHLIAIRGSVGTREHLQFLVDLATTNTLIDRKFAAQFDTGQKLDVTHFSRSISTNEVVLPSLTFGTLRVNNFPAYVTDLAEMPAVPTGTAGVLGIDFLSQGNVTFDFVSRKIVFFERITGEHQATLQKCAVGYAVAASWKNFPVKLALSNGVEVVTLDRDRMNGKPVKMSGLKPGTLTSNFSVTPVSIFKTKDILVNNLRLRGDGVLRKIEWPVASDELDGFLPLSALRASRVSLDFERGLLLWDGAEDKPTRAQAVQQPSIASSLREN